MVRVVVMGVAGSGKTTVGRALADRLSVPFLDADDAHPPENVAKMSAGIPLTDHDRAPWLDRLGHAIAGHDRIVVTCSALKRRYRDRLRNAASVTFVFLDVGPGDARRRVEGRTDHFMGVEMIDSQFAALERPRSDEVDVLSLDGSLDVATLIDSIVGQLLD